VKLHRKRWKSKQNSTDALIRKSVGKRLYAMCGSVVYTAQIKSESSKTFT